MIGYLVAAGQGMLAMVLLISVAGKVRSRRAGSEFLSWLRALSAVPDRFVAPVGVGIVLAEIGTLGLLVVPATRVAGLAAAAGLIGFFATAIGWLTRHGRSVPCRCFGAARRPMGRVEVLRNGALSVSGAGAAVLARGVAPGPAVGSGALLGAVLGLLATRADDVVQLLAPGHGGGAAGSVPAARTE